MYLMFDMMISMRLLVRLVNGCVVLVANANAAAAASSGLSPAVSIQNAALLQQLNRTNPVAAALASLPSAVNPSVAPNMPTNSVLLVGNLNTEVN